MYLRIMTIRTNETGVGLVEVLVAVLLLSVAVLGFSALQLQAVSATDESLIRTQTLSIVRGLAENMRANSQQLTTYEETINDSTATKVPCVNGCTAKQIAINESVAVTNKLKEYDINIKMVGCPGTQNFSEVKCVVAAWSDTVAELNNSNDKACADENGIYKNGSSCIIVETY